MPEDSREAIRGTVAMIGLTSVVLPFLLGAGMEDFGSAASQQYPSEPSRAEGDATIALRRLDLTRGATELLAIVAYVNADDGPLRTPPDSTGHLSPWHQRLLLKACERLEVIDTFLRSRVAFFVAGKNRGYYAPERELELAGAALDTCRATASVVDALLAGRAPSEREFDLMSATALKVYPALEAAAESAPPSTRAP